MTNITDRFNSDEETEILITDEFREGEQARLLGLAIAGNPYKDFQNQSSKQWDKGWCDRDMTLRMEDDYLPSRGLSFFHRVGYSWDFKSQIKHIWLTGYILITWEWDYNFWRTLDIGWYKGGSYK